MRIVDFKRNKFGVEATVKDIAYDPTRSAYLALLEYTDGELSYVLAPEGLKPGMKVKLVKEPDNAYDAEVVKVIMKGVGQVGYIANSVYTVKGGDVLEIVSKIFDTDERPRVATAIIDKNIASGATVECFITNNANDASPTWETYTEGSEHQFENDTKTAASWGVALKVKVTAGTATGEISVSAIALGVL